MNANLSIREVDLKDTDTGATVTATYLEGGDGVISNPTEPTLPLELRNVSAPGLVLCGVGFRGGDYTDLPSKIPLTGAATAEIRGVHAAFMSDVFFPIRPWSVNYLGALCESGGGETRLALIPAQFRSDPLSPIEGVFRAFSRMDFRLFYSANFQSYTYLDGTVATPGLAAPPAFPHPLLPIRREEGFPFYKRGLRKKLSDFFDRRTV